MKKIIFFATFSFIISAGLYFIGSSLFADNPGYVLIGIGNWSLESSLAVFSVVLCLLFFCLYVLFRSLGWLSRIPGKAKAQSKISTVNRSQDALVSGLVDSAEGNWEHAEKILIKHAESSTAPLIHYLTAARAAQSQGAIKHRDEYLDQASKKSPGSEMAIGLTHAELCLAQQQYDQALTILTRLQAINHEHASVLKLLHQTYVQLGDWNAVKTIMLDLNNNQQVTATELSKLQVESYPHILSHAAEHDDIKAVEAIWDTIPEAIQQVNTVETEYYSAMILVGAGNQIEHDITLSLAKECNQTLLILFGSIHSDDTEKQLEIAEQWGDLHPKDAVMMRVLGKLYIKAENYELADIYLTKSLTLSPTVTAYQLLGELMFAQGNKNRANELFKEGTALAAHDASNLVERKDSVTIASIEPVQQTETVTITPSANTDTDAMSAINQAANLTPPIVPEAEPTTLIDQPIDQPPTIEALGLQPKSDNEAADTLEIAASTDSFMVATMTAATPAIVTNEPAPSDDTMPEAIATTKEQTVADQIATTTEKQEPDQVSENGTASTLETANNPISSMATAMAATQEPPPEQMTDSVAPSPDKIASERMPVESEKIEIIVTDEQLPSTDKQESEQVSGNKVADPLAIVTNKPISSMAAAAAMAATQTPSSEVMAEDVPPSTSGATTNLGITNPAPTTEPETVQNQAKEVIAEPEKKKKFLGFFKNN